MKTSEALYAAADYIRKHGWTRGCLEDSRGRVCMIGALWVGVGERDLHDISPYRALREVCNGSAAEFNDVHCKSANDAIAAFEIGADIAAAEGR